MVEIPFYISLPTMKKKVKKNSKPSKSKRKIMSGSDQTRWHRKKKKSLYIFFSHAAEKKEQGNYNP